MEHWYLQWSKVSGAKAWVPPRFSHVTLTAVTSFLSSAAYCDPEFSPLSCCVSGTVYLALPRSLPSSFFLSFQSTLFHRASCGLDTIHNPLPEAHCSLPVASRWAGAAMSLPSLSLQNTLCLVFSIVCRSLYSATWSIKRTSIWAAAHSILPSGHSQLLRFLAGLPLGAFFP